MGRSPLKSIQNNRGQFLIEAVLLVTLSLGLLVWSTRYFREKKIIAKAVEGPWSRVSTMTESGIWAPNNATNIRNHPNTASTRGVTLNEF